VDWGRGILYPIRRPNDCEGEPCCRRSLLQRTAATQTTNHHTPWDSSSWRLRRDASAWPEDPSTSRALARRSLGHRRTRSPTSSRRTRRGDDWPAATGSLCATAALLLWFAIGCRIAGKAAPPQLGGPPADRHVSASVEGTPQEGSAEGPELLYRAAREGRAELVELLLAMGVSPNSRWRSGEREQTPLHVAAQYGRDLVVGILLRKGALVDARIDGSGWHERTPLHVACVDAQANVAAILVGAGADVNARDAGNMTPLHLAAMGRHIGQAERRQEALVELLLRNGAKPNVKDEMGYSPLQRAAEEGNRPIAHALLEAGAELDIFSAAALDKAEAVTAVIEADSAVIAALHPGLGGLRPLHWAARGGAVDTVRLLIDAGADVDAANVAGWSALHYAALEGHAGIVKWLLEAGANPGTELGNSPAALAANRSHWVVVEELVRAGADPNAYTSQGDTLLHLAVYGNRLRMAEILLRHGADATRQNRDGKTPIDIARDFANSQMIDLLRRGPSEAIDKFGPGTP